MKLKHIQAATERWETGQYIEAGRIIYEHEESSSPPVRSRTTPVETGAVDHDSGWWIGETVKSLLEYIDDLELRASIWKTFTCERYGSPTT